ncbi:uncharacterized protein EDB93DRAFT_152473 [Suillus bovinus]|uniref:uncharacterized protein n=1 Tax=Suillus bovinus TaxID=48563 RepID=UPI001B86B1D2|nr:uncharacterized protein EDB93DRAFT_152473 [Suillus bovinus]KAG2128649.1 hypothetical protein EDB93DRAFT_152473 [Suillus bovinus]
MSKSEAPCRQQVNTDRSIYDILLSLGNFESYWACVSRKFYDEDLNTTPQVCSTCHDSALNRFEESCLTLVMKPAVQVLNYRTSTVALATRMSRNCQNYQTSKRRANANGTRRMHTSQYQHFIPRFILRGFQVGSVMSRKEREEEFQRTGVDTECIIYYDVATGSLDIRPIRKVYGVMGIYSDVNNTRNINELEQKLAHLESQAASMIESLHKVLPRGIITLERSSLELLQKFLFLMRFRNEPCSSKAFEVNCLEKQARWWVEDIRKAIVFDLLPICGGVPSDTT